ncbi:MAG: hypothetical protein ACOYM4_18950 [Nodosilinea sp.]
MQALQARFNRNHDDAPRRTALGVGVVDLALVTEFGGEDDFFAPVPIQAELDQALLEQLKQRATAVVDVTLEDLIRLTF